MWTDQTASVPRGCGEPDRYPEVGLATVMGRIVPVDEKRPNRGCAWAGTETSRGATDITK